MPDSSNSHQSAVCSETMSNKDSSGDSSKKSASVQIDLGEITQHNIKVLKKVNQVRKSKTVKTVRRSRQSYTIKLGERISKRISIYLHSMIR